MTIDDGAKAEERQARVDRTMTSARVVVTALVLGTALLIGGPGSPVTPAGADASDAPAAPEAFRSLAAAQDHTCVLEPSGTLRCWGANGFGQLGQGTDEDLGDDPGEVAALAPIDLGTGRRATAVSVGQFHTCALLDNGQVKCWGDGGIGRPGLGDTQNRGDEPGEMGDDLPAVALGTGRTATAVVAGENHSCALLDNGQVKCWGGNSGGQLGLGDTDHRGDQPGEMGNALPAVALGTGRTATALSARGQFTCALLDNGRVKCWGRNNGGQLGQGDTEDRGDEPGEMGNALPAVNLGTGRTATALSAGREHVCAILDDQSLKCWGYNTYGQLGLGDTDRRGDAPGEMGNALPAVDLGTDLSAVGVAADYDHTCALLDDDNVKCWGDNGQGALGVGDTDDRGNGPGEMGDALLYADLGGPVRAVTTAEYHSCALLVDQTVKCWGGNSGNSEGNLGLGDTEDRLDEPGEGGSSLPVVPLTARNDDLANGRSIRGPAGTVTGTNANAGTQPPDEPAHAGFPAADSSVWYSWHAPASGPIMIDTFGSDFDTVLAVYTGGTLADLTPVASDDDTNANLQSEVRFDAAAGTTYRIAVAGFNGGSGRIVVNWRLALPCDGQAVTVALAFGDTPTAGDDVIRGTTGADTVDGAAGADRICGDAGADTLRGGTGADVDRLFGDNGADVLRGGAGNDVLSGGNQNDTLFGEGGTDTLNGGAQRDTCNGGAQADTHTGCEVRTSIP